MYINFFMNLLYLSILSPAGQSNFAFNTDLAIQGDTSGCAKPKVLLWPGQAQACTLPTFVRVLLRHALRHLRDDLAHLPRVLLDAHLLLRVEVGLHRVTQHDLRQHRHRAGRGVRPSF